MSKGITKRRGKGGQTTNQTTNRTTNYKNDVPTRRNNIFSNGLQENEVWLTVIEATNQLGISVQAVQKNCKDGKYTTRKIKGRGGMRYQIALSSLSETAQMKYMMERLKPLRDEIEGRDSSLPVRVDVSVFDLEELRQLYLESPDYNRKKYEKYYPFFMSVGYFETKYLPVYSRLVDCIDEWNKSPKNEKLNLSGVYAIEKELREKGYSAFFGRYGHNRGNYRVFEKFEPAIGDHLYKTFRKNYLNKSAPSANMCRNLVIEEAILLGVDKKDIPATVTFKRIVLADLQREHGVSGEGAVYFSRFGADAYNKKFGNYSDRDNSGIAAGNTWVFDHTQVDIMVKTPDGSKVFRFWLTAVVDFRSWKMLHYSLNTEAPSSIDIKEVYISAIEKYGVPQRVYLDNGKDFRCKEFSGMTHKIKTVYNEHWLGSILGQTGVETVKFALPYNAQVKPIERVFRKLHDCFERVLSDGYTGNNPMARTKELALAIKQGNVLSYDEFIWSLDATINWMNGQPMQRKEAGINGLSPDEVFEKFYEERPRIESDILCRLAGKASTMRMIRRNGFEDSEVTKRIGYTAIYWGDWMRTWQGETKKVYARRSLDNPEVAFFFSAEQHQYLGSGHLDFWKVVGIAETPEEIEKVRKTIAKASEGNKLIAVAIKTDGGASGREILGRKGRELKFQLSAGEVQSPEPIEEKATGTDGGYVITQERKDEVLKLLMELDDKANKEQEEEF